MAPRLVLVASLLVGLVAGTARAQAPERLVPAGSQVFLQIDPADKTRAAYDRTAYAKMMNGETGKFLRGLLDWGIESGINVAAQENLLTESDIELIKDGVKLGERLCAEGMTLGIELNQVWPVDGRLVVVLHNMSDGKLNMPGFLDRLHKRLAENENLAITKSTIAGRDVRGARFDFVGVDWWSEKKDFVMSLGTGRVADYIAQIDAGKTGLAKHPIHRKLVDFGDFPTRSRAFLDVPALCRLADKFSEEASKTVDELGLRGVGAALSISGYDGPALRGLTEIETIAPRTGLVALLSAKSLTLADLPPMPSDLASFSATAGNYGAAARSMMDLGEKVAKIFVPDQVDNIKQTLKGFEDIAGVDLRKDLFDQLDDLAVSYYAPSEGFGVASTWLIKVKDEAKVRSAIKNLGSSIPAIPGVLGGMTNRKYRDVEIFEFAANTPGAFATTCLCVHKGYLVYASYPQQVHGYILRTAGLLPTWKADERLAKALAPFPERFGSIAYSDPRPIVEAALSLAPPIVAFVNGMTTLAPGVVPFDISRIPHAQEATLGLFPNIDIAIDSGKSIRYDSRLSIGW